MSKKYVCNALILFYFIPILITDRTRIATLPIHLVSKEHPSGSHYSILKSSRVIKRSNHVMLLK